MGQTKIAIAACPLPIPRLAPAALDAELQQAVDRGNDPLHYGCFGHAPEVFKRWIELDREMRKGPVELRTKEIARLRIAWHNQCHY